MNRILIRSGKGPLGPVAAEASLARNGWGVFGANVGNRLFTDSVHRAVSTPGTEVVSNSLLSEINDVDDAYIARVNGEFSHFVVPLANAFRPQFVKNLRRLTRLIEKLTIPVTVVGIGAQLPVSAEPVASGGELDEVTSRFVRAVLERSASIGVRGEITQAYLRQLGFPDDSIDVIGCPSLLVRPEGVEVTRRVDRLTQDSLVSLNITPSAGRMAEVTRQHAERYPQLDVIMQEHYRLALLLWGEDPPQVSDPEMPIHSGHRLYREDRVRFFLDPVPWIDHLAERHFSFGTRIHGNIAALLGGTPATVLIHDSRTLELADYHEIPYRMLHQMPEGFDAAELYAEADFTRFNKGQGERFDRYVAFLTKNGIDHAFAPGRANPDFDAAVAGTSYPPAVASIVADGVDASTLVPRLRWLRQGAGVDKARTAVGAYRPPFGLTPAPKISLAAVAADVRGQAHLIGEQRALIDEQRALIDEQRSELARLREQVIAAAAPRPSTASRTLRRVRAGVARRLPGGVTG